MIHSILYKRALLGIVFLLCSYSLYSQSIFTIATPDGFAQGTTGGGLTLDNAVKVTTAAELRSAVNGTAAKVIVVVGIIDCTGTALSVGSNKTIIGANTNSGIKGKISVNNTNVILQNLIIGPGDPDCIEVSGGTKVFIHKCDIYDGADGSCDIVRQADWVTVSWCHFYYVNQTVHMNTCMVGNADNASDDRGKLHTTIHHNWWGDKVDQRMPRVRFGQVHIYNNYYGAPKTAAYCVGVGFESSIVLENNYFNDQAVAWRYQDLSTGGKIHFSNNILYNTVADPSIPNSLTFTPPYSYTMDDPAVVQGLVTDPNCGAGNLATCVTIAVPVTGVSVSPETATITNVGSDQGSTQITATVSPSDASLKTVSWSSSNSSVAIVNATGLVTGVSEGSATITATTKDGNFTATSTITVNAINVAVESISVSPTVLSMDTYTTSQLSAIITPSNASNKTVTWSSDNTDIATINSSGLVTGVAQGTATITATTVDGAKTATCTVDVTKRAQPTPLIKLGFNENDGTTITNDGTVSAAFSKTAIPTWSTNIPANGVTSSLDFGTTTGNNYVESNAVISELAGLTSFAVTGWVNCKDLTVGSGGNRIVSWINNGANGVDVIHAADGSIKVGINHWPDKSTAISSVGKITADVNSSSSNWKFFAVTYQSTTSTINFYFGDNTNTAILDKSLTYNRGAVGTTIGSLAVGHFNSQSSRATRMDRMFKGLIDQVEIYGTALSLSEIQKVQNITTATPVDEHLLSDLTIKAFPNPVKDILNIQYDKGFSNSAIMSIVDMTGKPVMQLRGFDLKNPINLSRYNPGLYLIKISDLDLNKTLLIIKQ